MQDDVARKLRQVPPTEIHQLVEVFATTNENEYKTFLVLVNATSTAQFLEVHGWTLLEYIEECEKDNTRSWVCPYFITFYNG